VTDGRLDGIGDLLRRGQQAHERVWVELVGSDLTAVQYGVLLTVGYRPGSSQQQIGDEMSIDKSTVGDVLHRLAAKGLVELARDAADARRHTVLLSAAGQSTVLAASSSVWQVGGRFLQRLSFTDGETLVRLLRLVAYQGAPPDPDAPDLRFPGWPLRLPVLHLDMAFGHLIRRAQRVYGALWRDAPFGEARSAQEVTPVQFDAMAVLADLGVADQGEWAERSSIDPATATSLVTRLTRRGLVAHTAHEVDRRRKQLQLTDQGERVLDKARGVAGTVEQEILRPLSRSEQAAFISLLREVRLT
jgi:MarR family transcriptional regulator, temperature-dependent positive regulator of motility